MIIVFSMLNLKITSADALSRLAITHTNDREMDVSTIHFVNDYFQGINKNMIQK